MIDADLRAAAKRVLDLFRARGLKIATAESCTGGLVAATLTEIAGSSDVVDRGFVMAGGGSLIRGIERLLSAKTGLPVTIADDPLSAVANGTGAVLNDLSWLMQNR